MSCLRKPTQCREKKSHKPWASLLSCSTCQEFQDLLTFHHVHFSGCIYADQSQRMGTTFLAQNVPLPQYNPLHLQESTMVHCVSSAGLWTIYACRKGHHMARVTQTLHIPKICLSSRLVLWGNKLWTNIPDWKELFVCVRTWANWILVWSDSVFSKVIYEYCVPWGNRG